MDYEKLKGSKTEQNLMTAFSGESQARNKYTYYASKAKKMVMSKLLLSLKKQLIMKKNMQNYGLNIYIMEKYQQLLLT